MFLITPPENKTCRRGSFALLMNPSNSNAAERATDFGVRKAYENDTFIKGLAIFPFQTNIIYSNFPSSFLIGLLGNRKLSRTSLLRIVKDSELATGTSKPLGVRFE